MKKFAVVLCTVLLCALFVQTAEAVIDERFKADNWQNSSNGFNCKKFVNEVMKVLFDIDVPAIYHYDDPF